MTSVRFLGALALPLLLALLVGCGSSGTQATTSSSATSTPSAAPMTPAPPPSGPIVPFRDYLASINVQGQPTPFADAKGLEVTVPVPDGWARTGDPLFASGIDYIQQLDANGNRPAVTLMAIRLDGEFDPADAIKHANADALPPHATNVTESFADFQGFPSLVTQGMDAGREHYTRIVIATLPSSHQRYLAQLTVTTVDGQTIAQSPQLTSIVDGFKVVAT